MSGDDPTDASSDAFTRNSMGNRREATTATPLQLSPLAQVPGAQFFWGARMSILRTYRKV